MGSQICRVVRRARQQNGRVLRALRDQDDGMEPHTVAHGNHFIAPRVIETVGARHKTLRSFILQGWRGRRRLRDRRSGLPDHRQHGAQGPSESRPTNAMHHRHRFPRCLERLRQYKNLPSSTPTMRDARQRSRIRRAAPSQKIKSREYISRAPHAPAWTQGSSRHAPAVPVRYWKTTSVERHRTPRLLCKLSPTLGSSGKSASYKRLRVFMLGVLKTRRESWTSAPCLCLSRSWCLAG